MNNVLFRRGNQTFIDENVPLNDGQIIFNETDEAIYVDTIINNVVTRKRYGGGNLSRSDIDMALSTTSENPVANKVLTELMLQKADVIDNLGTALAVTENGIPTGCKTIQGLNTKINTTQAQVSNSGNAYSSSKAYFVGDLCIYNNVLYRCITACSAGSWATNKSCFTEDTLVNATSNKLLVEIVRSSTSITLTSAEYFDIQFNVLKSGHLPIGIVGYSIENRNPDCNITGVNIADNTAHILGAYAGTSAIQVNPYVKVLYRKI